jgi:hypothetical protein
MRSPITQKGWSKPMMTSFVAEEITVRVMCGVLSRLAKSGRIGGEWVNVVVDKGSVSSTIAYKLLEFVVVNFGFQLAGGGFGFGCQVVAHFPAPSGAILPGSRRFLPRPSAWRPCRLPPENARKASFFQLFGLPSP